MLDRKGILMSNSNRMFKDGGRLGEGHNFYQKNNSPFRRLSFVPFGRVKLFLPVRGKNRVTDTDDIIANRYYQL